LIVGNLDADKSAVRSAVEGAVFSIERERERERVKKKRRGYWPDFEAAGRRKNYNFMTKSRKNTRGTLKRRALC
jgi:hypothetical protein